MDGPECGKDRGQDREVADRARRQLQALETGSRKVDAGDHQHHEDDHAQQPTPQQTVEGEGEDVERNVPMPDRILHVEGLLVEERQDRLPLSGPDLAEEEAKKEDHEQGEDGGGRRQWALPDADRRQPPAGVGVECQHDVGPADHPEEDGEDKEGPDLGRKARPEHAAKAKRPEPEIVGIQGREGLQKKQE